MQLFPSTSLQHYNLCIKVLKEGNRWISRWHYLRRGLAYVGKNCNKNRLGIYKESDSSLYDASYKFIYRKANSPK